jgi:hypothetical protein
VTSWFVEPSVKPLTRRDAPVEWPPADGEPAEWPPAAPDGRVAKPEAPADPDRTAPADQVDWPAAADKSTADRAGRDGTTAAHRASPADSVPADRAGRTGTTAAHRASPADPADSAAQPAAPAEAAASAEGADWATSVEQPVARPEPSTAPVGEWDTPADRTRQAAESALKPAIAQRLSDAGLPTRRPGAQLAPGAVVPRVREQNGGTFRDAAAVRTSLSRHYQGMRAARQETVARTEETGKDEVDPR